MKTILLIIMMLMFLATSVYAGVKIGFYDDSGGADPGVDIAVMIPMCKSWGTFIYMYSDCGWSEIYVGPIYSEKNFELALGLGSEGELARVGGWVWLNKGKWSLCHSFEDKGSGPWHKLELTYQVTPKYSIGLLDKRADGLGGSLGVSLGGGYSLKFEGYDSGYIRSGIFIDL